MRISIFIGLLYVAWCINPVTFDNQMQFGDYISIFGVLIFGLIGDLKDLFKNNKTE